VIVTALPGRRSSAIRNALLSHGWEGVSSEGAAASLEPWAVHATGLPDDAVEALLAAASKFGLDLLTGEGWAVLSGTRFRLSALARSWSLPPVLRELAVEIGRGLPADVPVSWKVRSGPVTLESEPVLLADGEGGAEAVRIASDQYLEAILGHSDVAAIADQARVSGEGVLLTAGDPGNALDMVAAALEAVGAAGLDPDQVAIDPGFARPGAADLAIMRSFGRPIVCSSDDPVVAVLALDRGAQLFRSSAPDIILRALVTARALGA
jgi:hypothetical protein